MVQWRKQICLMLSFASPSPSSQQKTEAARYSSDIKPTQHFVTTSQPLLFFLDSFIDGVRPHASGRPNQDEGGFGFFRGCVPSPGKTSLNCKRPKGCPKAPTAYAGTREGIWDSLKWSSPICLHDFLHMWPAPWCRLGDVCEMERSLWGVMEFNQSEPMSSQD